MQRLLRPITVVAVLTAASLTGSLTAGAGQMGDSDTGTGGSGGSSGAGGAAPEVEREILVQTVPAQAPEYDLYLVRVTVPPGAALAPHTHPGTQGARIERGTLTYQLLSGEATVVRAARGGDAASTETVQAPATIELRRGDAVIENPALVHEARNEGKRPVVILTTTLLTRGAPLSEPAG